MEDLSFSPLLGALGILARSMDEQLPEVVEDRCPERLCEDIRNLSLGLDMVEEDRLVSDLFAEKGDSSGDMDHLFR